MNDFLKKFNIFDVFSMLIPGLIMTTMFVISVPKEAMLEIKNFLPQGDYLLFFVLSYLVGLLFHEISRMSDCLWHRIYYHGKIREILLDESKCTRLIKNAQTRLLIFKHKEKILNSAKNESCDIQNNMNGESAFIFSYMLNYVEMKGYSSKLDKMATIAEMSSSLLNGFIILLVSHTFFGFHYKTTTGISFYAFLVFEVLVIIIMFFRKRRYEQFRISNLIRIFDFLQNNN